MPRGGRIGTNQELGIESSGDGDKSWRGSRSASTPPKSRKTIVGINPAAVYLISHRLTKQLKAEVEALRASLG